MFVYVRACVLCVCARVRDFLSVCARCEGRRRHTLCSSIVSEPAIPPPPPGPMRTTSPSPAAISFSLSGRFRMQTCDPRWFRSTAAAERYTHRARLSTPPLVRLAAFQAETHTGGGVLAGGEEGGLTLSGTGPSAWETAAVGAATCIRSLLHAAEPRASSEPCGGKARGAVITTFALLDRHLWCAIVSRGATHRGARRTSPCLRPGIE